MMNLETRTAASLPSVDALRTVAEELNVRFSYAKSLLLCIEDGSVPANLTSLPAGASPRSFALLGEEVVREAAMDLLGMVAAAEGRGRLGERASAVFSPPVRDLLTKLCGEALDHNGPGYWRAEEPIRLHPVVETAPLFESRRLSPAFLSKVEAIIAAKDRGWEGESLKS